MKNALTLLTIIPMASFSAQTESAPSASRPNIVFILADDLGYGDVHCMNPERCKIPTPCLDKLAAEGVRLTNAHASAALCTPSRYGLLTGRYNWRSPQFRGILHEFSDPLIAEDRLTVAGLLKKQGYETAMFGKWHLGMNWAMKDDAIDCDQPIQNGPIARGFDYWFGVNLPNFYPHCFVENDRIIGKLQGPKGKEQVPGWDEETILPTINQKACEYITAQAKTGKPFFVYYAMTSPHTPVAPSKEWQGKSILGPYGDFVMETDWCVGQVLEALEKAGIADNTLVFFSSDNGPNPGGGGVGKEILKNLIAKGLFDPKAEKLSSTKYLEFEALGHYGSGPFRGHKSDGWEGGHRVPTLARWPGKIKAGSSIDQLVSLVDFMATCAEITGAEIPPNAGEDSFSILPLLLGKSSTAPHEAIVAQSGGGMLTIQQGQWKMCFGKGSGGWGHGEVNDAPAQLYDLSKDIGETTNLYNQNPEVVNNLTKLMEKYIAEGRSTPGPKQANDNPVSLWGETTKKGKKTPKGSQVLENDN